MQSFKNFINNRKLLKFGETKNVSFLFHLCQMKSFVKKNIYKITITVIVCLKSKLYLKTKYGNLLPLTNICLISSILSCFVMSFKTR